MGKIAVNYLQVKQSYPTLVKEIETKIRAGKSKLKNDCLSSFSWCYCWAEKINGADSLRFDSLSVEDKVKDVTGRCFAYVQASKLRCCVKSSKCSTFPIEIKDIYKKQYMDNEIEKQRINALTPQEKQQELYELFKKLNKSPGFFVVKV